MEPPDPPTTTTVTASVNGNDVASETRKTETFYGTQESEWKLRKPRLVTTDPDSGGLQIKRKVTLNADGQEVERFQPRSQSSSEPSTTKTIYYTAGANPDDSACANRPEWMGLPCKVGPGAQPATAAGMPELPVQTITYNYLRQPLTSTETVKNASGGTETRTSTKTYDSAGRVITESVTGTVGTAVKTTKHIYDSATGRETATQSLNSDGTVFNSVTRSFDALGRQTGYTDAEGHASTTSYDLLSCVATKNDGKYTRQYSYDPITGDLLSVYDPGVGTFTGSYDADDRLTATSLPLGYVKSSTYDASGELTRLAYTKTTNCSSGCTWFDNTADFNIHGQMVAQAGNRTQSGGYTSQVFSYDAAGRLIETRDTSAGECTIRAYQLDADSNRTAIKTYAPGTGGACDPSATPTTKSSTYDAADRLTNSGYQYDAFGRITTVPAADAGGSSSMSAAYYVNDLARSITEGSTTQTLELDPLMRMRIKTKVAGTTTTTESYAYTDDSDAPAWIATDSTWNRSVEGLTGDIEMYQTSAGMQRVLIANIRGDTVAEGSSSTANQAREIDEFGVVKNGLPSTRRYGFHGTKQREALTTGGTIAMGVRLYVPRIGRFLQVDPVVGGSAGPYEYAGQDPTNKADLDGRWCVPCAVVVARFAVHVAVRYYARRAVVRATVLASSPKVKKAYTYGRHAGRVFNHFGKSRGWWP